MTLDRYILRELTRPFTFTFVSVVTLMSIEHLPALLNLARHVVEGRRFVLLSMFSLLPEYAAIALILALFLGVALMARKLALTSELDALRAAGCSNIRLMRVPALLGLLVGASLLGLRFEAQPVGERQLVALGHRLATGDFGIAIDPRAPVQISPHVMLHVDAVSTDHQSLVGLLVTTDHQVIAAERGTVTLDSRGALILDLKAGRIISRRGNIYASNAGFANLRLVLPGLKPRPAKVAESDRRASLTFQDLREAIALSSTPAMRRSYLGPFHARLAIGAIVMMLPWPALVLGLPTRRHASGFGLAVGIATIVAIIRTTSAIADARSIDPAFYGLWLTVGWATCFALLVFANRRFGDGFVERFALQVSSQCGRWLNPTAKRLED